MRDIPIYYEHTFNQEEYDKKRVMEALYDIIKYLQSNVHPQSQYQQDLLLKLEKLIYL